MKKLQSFANDLVMLVMAFFLAACSDSNKKPSEDGLVSVTLQTDWYAQAEHGGFYQALAEGYYEELGLDVTINQGGPNALVTQKVATGNSEFGIGRSDDVIVHASRGLPLVIVGALMQRDPQALLFHQESGIKDFKDLDGKTVMATPGALFLQFLERRYDITINVTPLDYGMSRFLADKDFIQQCFITNEPYYVAKEGASPGTLLIADSGFDPYRVIYANRSFAKKNPGLVKAFVAASIRGWESYMNGPRDSAHTIIRQANPKMTEEFMAFSVGAMQENNLIAGEGPQQATGLIIHSRIEETVDQLLEAGLVDAPMDVSKIAPLDYLPESLTAVAAE
ncbi:MAG: ABC transporter substrate-binding protein [Verrucomicrobia bacterium]|jgi:NitT/TauT family transport system substrate-binding protein|nr:ABC transporter substrate-binding protein [Verrucomicrobiota bacterium]